MFVNVKKHRIETLKRMLAVGKFLAKNILHSRLTRYDLFYTTNPTSYWDDNSGKERNNP